MCIAEGDCPGWGLAWGDWREEWEVGERVEVVGARFGDVDVRNAVFERVHLYGARCVGWNCVM